MAIKTFTTGEVLTASDTNTYLNNGGLVWIAQGSFTGATAAAPVAVQSVFNSTYSHYRLIIKLQGTGNANLLFQYYTGTNTVDNGAQYSGSGWSASGPTLAAFNEYNSTSHYIGYQFGNNVDYTHIVTDILSPNIATETAMPIMIVAHSAASGWVFSQSLNSYKNTTSQYTGFRFWPDANATTGNYWIYGYRIS